MEKFDDENNSNTYYIDIGPSDFIDMYENNLYLHKDKIITDIYKKLKLTQMIK